MKSYKRFLMGGAIVLGSMLMCSNAEKVVLATSSVADIVSPEGAISVKGASYKNGVYYTENTSVNLKLEASDNVTATKNLQMIISNNPATYETLSNDGNWQTYTSTVKWNLPNATDGGRNIIYFYLKDEAGNISPGISIDTSSEYTVRYHGEGSNIPAEKKVKLGNVFAVAIQEPFLENKYFIGWSQTEGGTVQWVSDEIIEAKYIKGDLDLYAIYSDTPPALSSMVEIGDYVDYTVSYENKNTKLSTQMSEYTGWRVLSYTDSQVVIVSAGTPLVYNNTSSETADTHIENLTNNFSSTLYTKNGFGNTGNTNVGTVFQNPYTQTVTSLNKNDVDTLLGKRTNRGSVINTVGSILDNGTTYLLSTKFDDTSLWCIDGETSTMSTTATAEENVGVRVKVVLNSGLTTTGRNQSGIWMITTQ